MILSQETGFAIKNISDGTVRARPVQTSTGSRAWQLYKTAHNARRYATSNEAIVQVTLTIEEKLP